VPVNGPLLQRDLVDRHRSSLRASLGDHETSPVIESARRVTSRSVV
jgi:hypothetical protein